MPLAGEQLTYGWALALCYHVGWRGGDMRLAVAVMCAESARYIEAYHENRYDQVEEPISTDWGLFQINDKAHPDFELPEMYRNAIANAKYARKLYRAAGNRFTPWAAYNSGNFQRFTVEVDRQFDTFRWEKKVPNVEKKYG